MIKNIIARKPKQYENITSTDDEYIVVDRGVGVHQRFVSATANPNSMAYGEWFWGHYFDTLEEALEHFNAR